MKHIVIVFLLFGLMFSQNKQHKKMNLRHHKMDKIERLKIIEVLGLNEETAVKFINLHKEMRNKFYLLRTKKREILNSIHEIQSLSEKEAEQYVVKLQNLEKETLLLRNNFISDMSKFLTYKQILEIMIFEKKFRDEITNYFMKRRGRMKGNFTPKKQ